MQKCNYFKIEVMFFGIAQMLLSQIFLTYEFAFGMNMDYLDADNLINAIYHLEHLR